MSPADRLLVAARAANPGRPSGIARHPHPGGGDVLVTWDRVAQRYEVGTEARILATGKRASVLSALDALLGGAT